MAPKISILIPTYNYGKFLPRALNSLFRQTFTDFEVIIVDDGSTDNTKEVLSNYAKKQKIKVIRQQNQGYVKAANNAFKEAKGKYIIKLDADDEFEPAILEELFNALEKNPSAAFAYCDYFEYFESTGERKTVSLKENLFNSIAIGILFRHSVLGNLYDPLFVFPEYDLLLRLQAKGHSGVHVPKTLFTYYRHKSSITANKEKVALGIKQLEEKYGKKIKIREY